LLKTGFFKQVRELKIQRKNPGSALLLPNLRPWLKESCLFKDLVQWKPQFENNQSNNLNVPENVFR
jgi:hypothetical protein